MNSSETDKPLSPLQDIMSKAYKLDIAGKAVLMEDQARGLQQNRDRQERLSRMHEEFDRSIGDQISKDCGGEGMGTEVPTLPARDDDMNVSIDSPTTTNNYYAPQQGQPQPQPQPQPPNGKPPSWWQRYWLPLVLLGTLGGATAGALAAHWITKDWQDTDTQYGLYLYEERDGDSQ